MEQIQETKVSVSEVELCVSEYAALKDVEKEVKTKLSTAGKYIKELMEEMQVDQFQNDQYELNMTESIGTIIRASDLLKDVGFKIPEETKEMIDKLFSVNITEAKKQLGALQLNKLMRPGKTTQSLRLKARK